MTPSSDTLELETPASTDSQAALPRAHACPSCGSPVEDLDRYCIGCGQEQASAAVVEEPAQRHFRCENCGSEVHTDATQRSYACLFCDSTYVVEFDYEETGRQRPEFVIGFAISRDAAQQKFREWLADNHWFRPGDLTRAEVVERLRGIYLPFWSFSMLARSRWQTAIGEYWYRTETYTTTQNGKTVTKTRRVRETEWWPLAGSHHHYYSGYLVSGSRGLSQKDAERIQPFHLPGLKRYQPYFLAGWLSEEYSLASEEALVGCQQEFNRRERENVARFMPGDTHRDLRIATEFDNTNSDLVLLPIYLLTYKYHDKVYRFLVNGQTGKCAGDKPLSRTRIAIAVLSALGLLLLLILLGYFLS